MDRRHMEYNSGVTKVILGMLRTAIVSSNGDLSVDDKPGSIGIHHILNTIYQSTSKEYAITCSGQFVLLDVKDNEFFDDYPKYNLEATFEEQSLDVKTFLANIIIENHYI